MIRLDKIHNKSNNNRSDNGVALYITGHFHELSLFKKTIIQHNNYTTYLYQYLELYR